VFNYSYFLFSFFIFEKEKNRKTEKKKMDSSYLNVTAKSFVPGSNSNDDKPSTKLVFNPFQVVPEEAIDDSILQLSEHLLSSDLLNDDYEEDSQQDSTSPPDEGIVYYSQPVQSNAFFAPFQAQQDAVNDGTSSLDSPLKNIWDAPSTTRQTTAWDSFEPYSSHENENEFDPTLQYYNDGYYDSATIQDIHKLSLQVTNPSAEEEQAENVGEDMSTLQMLQSIFSDLKDEELSATLENYDYDMDRAIESLLKSHTTNDNNNNNNNNASLPILSSTQSNTTSSSSSNTTAVLLGGKKRQVCRHFLAGECYRKDCWFVHDLSEKVCKFW
jgi:hypothetical protein